MPKEYRDKSKEYIDTIKEIMVKVKAINHHNAKLINYSMNFINYVANSLIPSQKKETVYNSSGIYNKTTTSHFECCS